MIRPRTIDIVLGNEPRSYREVLAAFLQVQGPPRSVLAVEPDELDWYVAQYHPVLVICSRLTEAIEAAALAWIVLYPEGERRVILGRKGQRVESLDLDLDDLLAFVDRVARPAQTGGEAVQTNGLP